MTFTSLLYRSVLSIEYESQKRINFQIFKNLYGYFLPLFKKVHEYKRE